MITPENFWDDKEEQIKPKVVILDNNPVSIAGYAEEYPENWKKICDAFGEDLK